MSYDTTTIIAFIIVASFCSTVMYACFISIKHVWFSLRFQLLSKEDVPKKPVQQAVKVNMYGQSKFERIFEMPSYARKEKGFYFPMNINDLKGK